MDAEALLNELSAALADLVAQAKASSDEVASGLADVVAALEKRQGADLAPVVAAIRELRITAPAINVQVEPTPVQVNVSTPDRPLVPWDVRPEYDRTSGRLVNLRFTPVLPAKA
jgi:hypothetical protein